MRRVAAGRVDALLRPVVETPDFASVVLNSGKLRRASRVATSGRGLGGRGGRSGGDWSRGEALICVIRFRKATRLSSPNVLRRDRSCVRLRLVLFSDGSDY
jgi:hypothetical protein